MYCISRNFSDDLNGHNELSKIAKITSRYLILNFKDKTLNFTLAKISTYVVY